MKVSLNWVKSFTDVKVPKDKLLELIGQRLGAIDEVIKAKDDTVIDIENKMFTHRPDCFGILGLAREIAGIQHLPFTSPDWYLEPTPLPVAPTTLPLVVRNDEPKLVPRFMAVALDGLTVGPSPAWMQSYLHRVDIKSVNNIVDVTNYVMYLTGQPLHAFDYDKLLEGEKTATLIARKARKGEKIRLLNGKEYVLEAGTLVLASKTLPADVAGIMGGADTEVGNSTTRVVLSCANFDMYAVRRASMTYGIFTEAVTRFTKNQSPLQNEIVLRYAVDELIRAAGGAVASEIFDPGFKRPAVHTIKVSADFVNERLGLKLTAKTMQQLLQNVEFAVRLDGDMLKVTPPFWRTDIHIHEDVVEEVGRLYGYDQLPLELPQRDLKAAPHDELFDFKHRLRDTLSRAGANEVLTYSFIHGDLMKKTGQDPTHAYQIANALSPELQYYRTGLTPSLLDKIHMDIKAGFDRFALFELNKVHYKGEMDENDPKVPNEDNHIALVIAYGDKQMPSGAAYYHARKFLEYIDNELTNDLTSLADFDIKTDEWGRQLTAPYEPQRSAVIVKEGQIWGVVGEYRASVRQALKLPVYCAGFEINLGVLRDKPTAYQPLPDFPKVEQDITLRVPASTTFADILQKMKQAMGKLTDNTVWEFKPVDIYQPKGQKYKHVTLRLTMASYERTLKAEEVNTMLDQAAVTAKAERV